MLDRLRQLQGDVADLMAAFDPALIEGSAAKTAVELSASVVKMLVAFQALAAARVEECNAFGASDRTAAEWLGRTTGMPVGEANALLGAARRLGELPTAEAAFRADHLSPAQAKEVVSGATADPSAEEELCDLAKRGDLVRLRDRSRDVRNSARSEDDAARAARLHALRSVRTWMDDEGMGCGKWRLTPDAHAMVLSALELQRKKTAKVASAAGDSYQNALADSLVAAVSSRGAAALEANDEAKPVASRWQGVVLVDVETLRRGHVHDDERCEIDGVGSIPVITARDLLGDASLDLVLNDGLDIRSVVHVGRQFTRAQRTALIARDRTCIRPSCNAKRGLEFEHRDSYANTLATSVDSGARVCRRDHTSRPTAGIGTPGVPDFGSGICLTAPSSTSDRHRTGRAHSQRPGNRSRAVPGSRCAHTAFRRAGRVTGVAFDRRVAGLVWRSLPWLLRTRLTRAFLALALALGAGYHYDVGPSRSVVARGTRTVVSAGTDQVQRASARSADMLERVLLDVLDQAVPTPTP